MAITDLFRVEAAKKRKKRKKSKKPKKPTTYIVTGTLVGISSKKKMVTIRNARVKGAPKKHAKHKRLRLSIVKARVSVRQPGAKTLTRLADLSPGQPIIITARAIKPVKRGLPPLRALTLKQTRRTVTPVTPVTPAKPVDPVVDPGGGSDDGVAPEIPVYTGPWTQKTATRLSWRAGFGPAGNDVKATVAAGMHAAVEALTRPAVPAVLTGPEPTDSTGSPIAPYDASGHDHCWWLDRMVRSDQGLIERMALVWHDWFATSRQGADQRLMIAQNETFRVGALGSFADLLMNMTKDPAMLLWLNGNQNRKGAPNENYARELMELFSLGADRGAYTETDIREAARGLTGWRNDYSSELGSNNFRFDVKRWDENSKTVFGHSGAFNWADIVELCLEHPLHASFFVNKLWSYFIPTPPDAKTRAGLEALYVRSGKQIRPVVEAILKHPDFYQGETMVKPPVVYQAGLLRNQGRPISTTGWTSLAEASGQRLFFPPDVSGWDDERWLDSSTFRGRWLNVAELLKDAFIATSAPYDMEETPAAAVAAAISFWREPDLTDATRAALLNFAQTCLPATMNANQHRQYRIYRQNALRQLIAVSSDFQVC